MSVCDNNCRDCVFRAWVGFRLICNFLGVMGRRRGCPAGAGCAEKIVGEARQSIEAMVYRIPPNAGKEPERGTEDPSSAPSGHLPPGEGKDGGTAEAGKTSPPPAGGPSGSTRPPQSGGSPRAESPLSGEAETGDGEAKEKKRKKELTAEEIAERKRKKAEYHREWAKKNREHVREYQRERWRKKREEAEAGTGGPSSAPAGHLTAGEGKDERTGKDRG